MTVKSDNRVVSMCVRLSLRQPKSTGPKEKIDCKYFSSRPELQDQYTVEVVNHFQALGEEEEGEEEDVRNVEGGE